MNNIVDINKNVSKLLCAINVDIKEVGADLFSNSDLFESAYFY